MTTADLFLQYDRVLSMAKTWVVYENHLATKKDLDVSPQNLWVGNMLTRTLASIKEEDLEGFSRTSSYARLMLVYEQIKLTCSDAYMSHLLDCALRELKGPTYTRVKKILSKYPCMVIMSVLSHAYVQLNEQKL